MEKAFTLSSLVANYRLTQQRRGITNIEHMQTCHRLVRRGRMIGATVQSMPPVIENVPKVVYVSFQSAGFRTAARAVK